MGYLSDLVIELPALVTLDLFESGSEKVDIAGSCVRTLFEYLRHQSGWHGYDDVVDLLGNGAYVGVALKPMISLAFGFTG